MDEKINVNGIYTPSEDVVIREVEGGLVIIPLVYRVGDTDDVLYFIDKTGKAIWDKLDGKRNLNDVVIELTAEFESPFKRLKGDVTRFVDELLRRKVLTKVS